MSVFKYTYRLAVVMCALCLAATTLALPAWAEAPLTKTAITNFIATMPPLEELGKKYEDSDWQKTLSGDGFSLTDMASPFSASVSRMKNHPAYPEFLQIIKGHGFASAEGWANTADRVVRAYITSKTKDDHSQAENNMAGAMEALKNNPNLSPEQAAAMQQLLANSAGVFAAYRAPAEDVKAVEPFIPQLEKVIEQQNKQSND